MTIARRLQTVLGPTADVELDAAGVPRVAPDTMQSVALVVRTAAREGWRLRVEGGARWSPPDAPADLALSTGRLRRITYLNGADLVTTVEAGLAWEALRGALADEGAWIAADPPGDERSVGSVVVTGTAGPLRAGFGGIRDHIVGLTLVTGDGRIVQSGGRVVKNVAGFDLAKLVAGSFGAFGIVVATSFRLRAVPRADVTLAAEGVRDALLAAARGTLDGGLTPAALELCSPSITGLDDWRLAVRLVGADAAVEAERDAVGRALGASPRELAASDAADLWHEVQQAAVAGAVTVRLGALPAALDDALDLVAHHLPEGRLTVSVTPGAIRWSGDAGVDDLRLLRHAAAQREMPLTLERAPWALRERLGHFGAYREGVGRLVTALRRTFDPAGVFVTAVGDER